MSLNTSAGAVPTWTLGDRLRKAREHAGLEQTELSDRTSIARATISAAERGHRKPTRSNLRLWALATGVPLEWIETGRTTEEPPPGGGLLPHLDSNQEPIGFQPYMRRAA